MAAKRNLFKTDSETILAVYEFPTLASYLASKYPNNSFQRYAENGSKGISSFRGFIREIMIPKVLTQGGSLALETFDYLNNYVFLGNLPEYIKTSTSKEVEPLKPLIASFLLATDKQRSKLAKQLATTNEKVSKETLNYIASQLHID